jgi:HK97 gp10 family phage protein
MAKMTIQGLDEYVAKLSKLGSNTAAIAKRAVRAGANPVADEVRNGLEKNIRDPGYAGLDPDGGIFGVKPNYGKSTGDLLNSLGVSPPSVDKNGVYNCKIGFAGYDRKGVPNVLKARAMESGTSKLRKRPFIRPAVNRAKKRALEEMEKSIDADLKIYAD